MTTETNPNRKGLTMNHIKKLEAQVVRLTEMLEANRENHDDLIRYLSSSKFNEDPTVQVTDVIVRMAQGRGQMSDVYWGGKPQLDTVGMSADELGLQALEF